MSTKKYAFKLGDKVTIPDLEKQKAFIDARADYLDGEDLYRVVYWYDGQRKAIWVTQREIKVWP